MEPVAFAVSAGERAEKYDAVARKWTTRPTLPACWRGGGRLWFIGEGAVARDDEGEVVVGHEAVGPVEDNYQNQLFCRHWKTFINPSGHTCDLCKARAWPELERWLVHVIPAVIEKAGAQGAMDALVARLEWAVDGNVLTPAEAAEVEFALQSVIASG